jgi:hypothetical protein
VELPTHTRAIALNLNIAALKMKSFVTLRMIGTASQTIVPQLHQVGVLVLLENQSVEQCRKSIMLVTVHRFVARNSRVMTGHQD